MFKPTLIVLLTACTSTDVQTARQAVTAEDLTVVYQMGDPEAPTDEELSTILVAPPAGTGDPTSSDITAVAQSVYDGLPDEGVEELSRPGGGRIGCVVDWNLSTCWVSIGGRTYWCSGTSTWMHCGSFSGGWL